MTKIPINGSQFFDDLKGDAVCSHLLPIVTFLKSQGLKATNEGALEREAHGPWILNFGQSLPIGLVERHFELPKNVVTNRSHGVIACSWCWCELRGAPSAT